MKKAVTILTVLTLLLGGVAVALWLLPTLGMRNVEPTRFGLSEGLELIYKVDRWGDEVYAVCDEKGRQLFTIPLRNCMLASHYEGGRLRFKENATEREGYIDRSGHVVFLTDKVQPSIPEEAKGDSIVSSPAKNSPNNSSPDGAKPQAEAVDNKTLAAMVASHPFYKEASKVLSGRLAEDDAQSRRVILNYCEHFRTAYTTKDVDFIRQVFSEQALIIVGNVVKARPGNEAKYIDGDRVVYNVRSKQEYLSRLQRAFAATKSVDVSFSDFHIMRHPTVEGIYGVTLRQRYKSDRYADDGYLFLLWDFRNKSMPQILVRTWQPSASVDGEEGVISIKDFNLQ